MGAATVETSTELDEVFLSVGIRCSDTYVLLIRAHAKRTLFFYFLSCSKIVHMMTLQSER